MTEFLDELIRATPHSVEVKEGSIARVEKEGRRHGTRMVHPPPKVVRSFGRPRPAFRVRNSLEVVFLLLDRPQFQIDCF